MKRISFLLTLWLVAVLLVGCGTQGEVETANEDPVDEASEQEESGETEEDTDTEGEEQEPELKTETGIYVGQADPHTIEIETSDGPVAFQLTMSARDDVAKLTDGVEVTYTYYEDGEQLIIETIKANTSSSSGEQSVEKITETGIYNGQADPHTIEIETDDGPMAFQLTMSARDDVAHLTEGGQVTFTYYEEGDQLIIETIQHSDRVKMTETGIYVGQADPHTIEIETSDGFQAFQLTMSARDDVAQLRDGREVTYTYYQDGEQLVVETIKEKE